MSEITIEQATKDDIPAITDIYNYYVTNTNFTLDWTEVSIQKMHDNWTEIQSYGFPFLVMKDTNSGKTIGYAYVNYLRKERIGWQKALSVSIYLSQDQTGKGYGPKLLNALIDASACLDITTLVSYITVNTHGRSEALHQKVGFVKVGQLKNAGYKNKIYCDIAIYQYLLQNNDV